MQSESASVRAYDEKFQNDSAFWVATAQGN